jgi:WD40 repeat protein
MRSAAACLGDFVGLTPVTFANLSTNIESACLAPSGTLVALGMRDQTIRLLDPRTGEQVASLTYTNGIVSGLCFDAAGDHLYAVTGPTSTNRLLPTPNRHIDVWSRNTEGNWSEVENLTVVGATRGLFSTDGGVFDVILEVRPFKSGLGEGFSARFRLFNLATKAFVDGYEVAENPCKGVDFSVSGNGRLLGITSRDDDARDPSVLVNLYEWGTRGSPKQLRWPADADWSLSYDGKYVSMFSEQGAAIYSVPSLERAARFKEGSARASLTICAGKLALARRQQNRVRLWDLAKEEDMAMLDEPDDAKPGCFSPDGNSLLTLGSHHARLYRLRTPEKLDLQPHTAPVPGVAFSLDGLHLASVGKDHSVRVYDALTGKILWTTNDLPGQGQCLAFSPDGLWLAVGIWDSYLVWIRAAQTGQRLIELGLNSVRDPGVSPTQETLSGGRTFSVQFSPDGHYLAVAGWATNGVRIYSIKRAEAGERSGGLEVKLLNSAQGGTGLVFAPDSQSLAFSSWSGFEVNDQQLYFWEFRGSAQPRRVGTRVPGNVESCSFTPDSRYLLAIDDDGAVVTLDATTGQPISAFTTWKDEPSQPVIGTRFLSLSPNGSRLAVSSASRIGVEIRDPKSGRVVYSLPEEASTVYWLAWSPDSQRLAVSRDNGNIAIWDLETVDQILAELGLSH